MNSMSVSGQTKYYKETLLLVIQNRFNPFVHIHQINYHNGKTKYKVKIIEESWFLVQDPKFC